MDRSPWAGDQPSQARYLHTGQHKHWINAHASSRIRTHGPNVRAGEDNSCLRPLQYWPKNSTQIEQLIFSYVIKRRWERQSNSIRKLLALLTRRFESRGCCEDREGYGVNFITSLGVGYMVENFWNINNHHFKRLDNGWQYCSAIASSFSVGRLREKRYLCWCVSSRVRSWRFERFQR
jgi:hypothetical protein